MRLIRRITIQKHTVTQIRSSVARRPLNGDYCSETIFATDHEHIAELLKIEPEEVEREIATTQISSVEKCAEAILS